MSHCDSAPAAKRPKTTNAEYFSIEVKGHGSKLLLNMNRARLEERFCDFKIKVGEQTIHAHKIVLAEGSDYFRVMLSHPMKESNEGIVEMADMDFECLKICVEYIYVGKITVREEKLQSLLEVAHRLQLNELYEGAVQSVGEDLTVETFFTAKGVALSLGLKQLQKKCDKFALKYLLGITLQEDFVKIDSKYLKFLMTAKESPAVKCQTLLVWTNHDPENRGKQFEEFFLNLDLDDQSPSYELHPYINFLKKNEPLFFNSDKCMKKVMPLNISTTDCRDIDLQGKFRESNEINGFAVFDKTSKAIHSYNPMEDKWTELHKLAPEISELSKFTAIRVGEDIFVFAADKRNWKLRYTRKNSTWSTLPNRSITREVVAVEVDGLIYAFDETDENSKAVEVYDGSKWSHTTDKPDARCGTYIVAVEDSIYCIGGYTADDSYPHCNKYDTRTKCWSSLPDMPGKRSCGSAAALGRRIYVIGGRDENRHALSTCLLFDIGTEVWRKVARLDKSRYYFRAVLACGRIYAIGGVKSGKTVEELHSAFGAGRWETVETLIGKNIVANASIALL